MWAGSSSSSINVSVWVVSRLGGSNDGASGFKGRGAVPTGWEDVSLVTRKDGAEALPDPVSVTAVSKGILKLVSKGTIETGAGWGTKLGNVRGMILGLNRC